MAGMENVRTYLQPALDPLDPAGLFGILQAAITRAEYEQGLIAAATHGSEASQAATLNRRMTTIVGSLGGLMGEAIAAAADKRSLLTSWGIESNDMSPDEMQGQDSQTAQGIPSLPHAHELAQKEQPFNMDLPAGLAHIGPRRLNNLACRGIFSVRDVLVAGYDYILETRHMGDGATDALKKFVSQASGQPVTAAPTVAEIAALCPSLKEVSWAALRDRFFTVDDGLALGWRERRISVYDLITLSQDDLINLNPTVGRWTCGHAVTQYHELVRKAHVFALEFETVKRSLRPS